MNRKQLVESIYAEIDRLKQAASILNEESPKRTPVKATSGRVVGYTMNKAARERIAQAQKARWAKVHEAKESKIKANIEAAKTKTKEEGSSSPRKKNASAK